LYDRFLIQICEEYFFLNFQSPEYKFRQNRHPTFGQGRQHVQVDGCRPGTLTEERDIFGVTTEISDISFDHFIASS